MLDRVFERNFGSGNPFVGGIELFTYQLALGVSIRYFHYDRSIMLRLYLVPFKVWFNICIRKEK